MTTHKLIRLTCVLVFALATTVLMPAAEKASKSERRASKSEAASAAKIDVNTADVATLETLPGVGLQTAKAIVAGRPYTSVDDLERVAGIGPARLKELRSRVTVSSRSTAATPRRESASERRERDLEPTGRTTTSTREPAAGGQAKVNLNTATLEELEALPEIGPVRARAIMEARPFKSVDDLKRVKGIKDLRLEELRPYVTVR